MYHVLFEAVLESAAPFVIQLYVMSVQEEPVSVIQMISFFTCLLNLAWPLTTVKVILLQMEEMAMVKYKFSLFVTQVLLLSSRLLGICYFIFSYQRLPF